MYHLGIYFESALRQLSVRVIPAFPSQNIASSRWQYYFFALKILPRPRVERCWKIRLESHSTEVMLRPRSCPAYGLTSRKYRMTRRKFYIICGREKDGYTVIWRQVYAGKLQLSNVRFRSIASNVWL